MITADASRDVSSVIITGDLAQRPSRAPDHEAEARALTALMETMSTNPGAVLQRLVEVAMELTRSDSAGISLLEPGGEQGTFRWAATAGAWAPYRDGTMPREQSPCDEVISREAVLLVREPERVFPTLLQAQPGIGEGLLAPFNVDGVPAGTVWVIMHGPERRFEAEDARLLNSLGRCASVAHQMVLALGSAEAGRLASDTRLQGLARASSDVFYTMSPDMTELRELSGGDFIADTTSPSLAWLKDYIPPEDHARTVAATTEAIRTKRVFELEHRVRQVDGEIGWALSRAVPILGTDGEIVEWFGAASDITARKQSEERQAFLLRLSDALRAEPSAEALANRALRMLSERMRLDRCYVGVYRLVEDIGEFPQQVHDDRLPPLPAQVRLSNFPEALRVAYDRTLVVDDIVEMKGLSDSDRAGFHGLGMRALIAATLRKGENHPLWAIVAVSTCARVWTQGEVALVEEVAERTWAAIQRARAEAALRDSEERFLRFSDASTSVLWIRDAATLRMEFASPAFVKIYGVPRPDRGGDPSLRSWARLIEPESRKTVLDNFRRVRNGQSIETEFRVKRASDGALRWVHNTDFPLRDAAGHVRWVAGLGADITDAKEAVDRQGVLVAELQHRTRNLMGIIRSISDKTGRASADLSDFRARFRTRLDALARVQGLLSRLNDHDRVTFDELINAELSALAGAAARVSVDGPKGIPLRSSMVQTLAMAVHELATNAVKYGALGQSSGHLAITWELDQTDPVEPRLNIDWRESGVIMPSTQSKANVGQGRELIERALPYQLSARTSYELRPDGVHCTISVPAVSARVEHA